MNARGQTEVVGVVLLLAITVIGVGVVVAAAGGALETAQDQSSVQRAEQSMSLFDARSALVALGRSDGQSVSMGRSGDGTYEVRPDTGRIVVVKDEEDGSTTEYLNETLGSVVYERGNAEVAYQGGGVWRSVGEGSSMVSPPEFNYQDATLTLPVILVGGDADTAAGGPSAQVRPESIGDPVFPAAGRSNPLENGTVTVAVESEYYRGWASFFRDRTTGNVSVHPDEERVELELIARGGGGEFALSDTPPKLRGLAADEPMDSMSFTLRPENPSGFRPADWSLVVTKDGADRLELSVGNSGPGNGGGGGVCNDKQLPVTATYVDGGTTHTWENDSAIRESGSSFTVDCEDGTPTLHLDFTGETNLTYADDDAPLSDDSIGSIVNYAIGNMGPNVDLRVEKQGSSNSAGVQLETSTGEIGYSSSDERVVTFLHVTKNTVNVTVQ